MIVCAEVSFYPMNCDKEYFNGAVCVMTCDGDDACIHRDIDVPASSSLKHFVVRCANGSPSSLGPSCDSISIKKMRLGVSIYLMCISECNAVERAVTEATYVYCKDNCAGIQSKGINQTTSINGLVPVVIFTNGFRASTAEDTQAPYATTRLYAAGVWIQGNPSGCSSKCGDGAGLSGSPGAVYCSASSCDQETKPDPKICPKTTACGA